MKSDSQTVTHRWASALALTLTAALLPAAAAETPAEVRGPPVQAAQTRGAATHGVATEGVVTEGGGFVGTERCAACHAVETARWRGSHHDHAMAEADETSVLGDFDDVEFSAHGVTTRFSRSPDGGYRVLTDGADGALAEFTVSHTFGWYPLQQYLVPLAGGRLQALGVAWDSRPASEGGQRWFHLYPDEPVTAGHRLHWTSREQTWNYQCAECHSTNLAKGYDLSSDTYETTWSAIDVACEACHGPGAAHLAWAEADTESRGEDPRLGLAVDLASAGEWHRDAATGRPVRTGAGTPEAQLETCALCHSRRGQLWAPYTHGQPLLDTHRLALLDERLYFVDGQIRDEVYVHGSFLQSRMHAAGVACSDCHDPHALSLRAEGNALCTRCHEPEQFDVESHHHHPDGSAGAACTACHMPQRTYMVIDERADHSLRVPRPDLAARLGTPDACSGCHTDRDARWAAEVVAGWNNGERPRTEHHATTFDAAARRVPGADARLLSVAEDVSLPAIVRASALPRLTAPGAGDAPMRVARLAADPEPLVRLAAVETLERLDLRARAAAALRALDDPVRAVRRAAARALAPALNEQLPDEIRGPIARGLDEYLLSIRVNADRPESHLESGTLAMELRRAQTAEAAYRTALRLDPGFAPGYANLADLYRMLGREEDVVLTLERGLTAAPGSAALHHALGLARVRAGNLGGAVESLEAAAHLEPDSARYALVLGVARRESGDVRGALRALEAGLAVAPADRDLLSALAATHAATGDLESANEYQRRLERLAR